MPGWPREVPSAGPRSLPAPERPFPSRFRERHGTWTRPRAPKATMPLSAPVRVVRVPSEGRFGFHRPGQRMHQADGTASPLCVGHQRAPATKREFSSLDKVGAPAGGRARGPQKPPLCWAAAAESAACCPWRADGPAARPAEGESGQRAPFTGQLHSYTRGAAAVWAAQTCPAWERVIAPAQELPRFPHSPSWLPRD